MFWRCISAQSAYAIPVTLFHVVSWRILPASWPPSPLPTIFLVESRQQRNNQYVRTLMIDKGTPTLANSMNVKVVCDRFSAFWMMITLLAAPRMNRFPAIVLPAAICSVDVFMRDSRGKYNATNGTSIARFQVLRGQSAARRLPQRKLGLKRRLFANRY